MAGASDAHVYRYWMAFITQARREMKARGFRSRRRSGVQGCGDREALERQRTHATSAGQAARSTRRDWGSARRGHAGSAPGP
eukprot:347547-Pleurochrysis_carterae.AAC.3